MNDKILKSYYCKKTYNDEILEGKYYDIYMSNNILFVYNKLWESEKAWIYSIHCPKSSDIYKNLNEYFILATIHDRKLKLEELKYER